MRWRHVRAAWNFAKRHHSGSSLPSPTMAVTDVNSWPLSKAKKTVMEQMGESRSRKMSANIANM